MILLLNKIIQANTKSDNLSKILFESDWLLATGKCLCIGIALSHLINVVERRWWCLTTLVEDEEEKLMEQVSRTAAILFIC